MKINENPSPLGKRLVSAVPALRYAMDGELAVPGMGLEPRDIQIQGITSVWDLREVS